MREVLEYEYPPGETCPECGSDHTLTVSYLTSGFGRMVCTDCDHEWVGEGWEMYG